jgi:CheY-like chemotaxis protein
MEFTSVARLNPLLVDWRNFGDDADALREAGFEIQTAANGVDALKLMQDWIPGVIVLDLMMPRLDGTGFTELMRLNPRYASVPVLLVTAAYGAEQAAEQVGARAWLSKPFELDDLVEKVAQLAGALNPTCAAEWLRRPPVVPALQSEVNSPRRDRHAGR